ncbi:unnamed protein product [Allacma fusca]|uniref:Uncharacterized protein n=1 Tax=Allacma fusca TaxID=39272 RepID=A0A8J2K880_9HEXA|nr:unnamed protein product [Allacma fusca]
MRTRRNPQVLEHFVKKKTSLRVGSTKKTPDPRIVLRGGSCQGGQFRRKIPMFLLCIVRRALKQSPVHPHL